MFFEAMDLYREHWIYLQSKGQLPFENNFKQMVNCSVTRANTHDPNKLEGCGTGYRSRSNFGWRELDRKPLDGGAEA